MHREELRDDGIGVVAGDDRPPVQVSWQVDRPVTPFPTITLRPEGVVWVKVPRR